MCGVAGYFGKKTIERKFLERCQILMRRRGPDDEDYVIRKTGFGERLYLLHSRLSILDLDDRSRQPFIEGDSVLSYNGETYNYRELRQDYLNLGETFRTNGDTEVVSKLLNKEGIESISHAEGMWAFAWFNSNEQMLYLCRDRFGEKPLYFYQDPEGVYFGSEPKFIFALLGKSLPVNLNHLKRYLVTGYKSLYKTKDTFFEGLNEVAPGTYKAFGKGNSFEKRYWYPKFDGYDYEMTHEQAVKEAKEALIRSVELRLRSDVPVAFCLSGGIDSNALISIARRELGYQVHGFTIMNTDVRYEEREMVEHSVRDLNLVHTEVPITTDNFLVNLKKLINYHDAPILTITYYAQWRLMKAIRNAGYKVSISGTGADELFSGYFDHHNAYLAEMKFENRHRYEVALDEWKSQIRGLVRNPFLSDPDYFAKNMNSRDHIYLDEDIFNSALHEPIGTSFEETFYSKSLLRNRMANELLHESVPVILHEDDLNAMYYSVENRSPFLDKSLFNLCQRIPTINLIKNGKAKSVLREAVRGIAPNPILDNPRKVGFNVPLLEYLDTSSPSVAESLLDNSPIFDVVKREEIEALIKQKELANSRSKFLFNFICAKLFLEEFAS